jgi:hypothetical protein
MSVPLRNDEFGDENLTTADLAQQGKRPAASEDRLNADRLNEDRQNLENRLQDDRIIEDRTIEDRTIDAGIANAGTVNDRPADDRPGPILAARPASEGTRGAASELRGPAGPRTTPDTAPLFPGNELEELRNRWSGVQTAFVDEPRRAVEQADGLVASAMKRLAEVFAEERSKLEQQWDRGDNVSTEDLRIALQRYRSFFQRLLSV